MVRIGDTQTLQVGGLGGAGGWVCGRRGVMGEAGRACLEAGSQLTGKHEAIQLVGAVGHEVAFVPNSTARHSKNLS